MKKFTFLIVATFLISVVVSSSNFFGVSAQCSKKKFVDSCSVFPPDFVFAKSRVIEINSQKDVEKNFYSVFLNKGTSYLITVCEGKSKPGKMVVKLLDNKDRLVMSNYDYKSKKHYSKVVFNCNATGNYFLNYLFEENEDNTGCGVTILAYQKKK